MITSIVDIVNKIMNFVDYLSSYFKEKSIRDQQIERDSLAEENRSLREQLDKCRLEYEAKIESMRIEYESEIDNIIDEVPKHSRRISG